MNRIDLVKVFAKGYYIKVRESVCYKEKVSGKAREDFAKYLVNTFVFKYSLSRGMSGALLSVSFCILR